MEPKIEPPEGLSADALDLFKDVTEARGLDMTPEQFGALIQACRLVTLADRAEAALGESFVVDGYRGQPVANGLLTEIRLSRASAVAALKAAGLAPASGSSASDAGRLAGRARLPDDVFARARGKRDAAALPAGDRRPRPAGGLPRRRRARRRRLIR